MIKKFSLFPFLFFTLFSLHAESLDNTAQDLKPPLFITGEGSITIDFQTTENTEEKVTGVFGNSATVSFKKNDAIFLRLDGLLGNPKEVNEFIVELITHYHTDHVTRSIVERCLNEGSFYRIVGPYPSLSSSRERVFALLTEREELNNQNNSENPSPAAKDEDPVIDISRSGIRPLRSDPSFIGGFYYSFFEVNEDIKVEIFKYESPRNVNSDGLIFRIIHKNITYLLFGDFDDPGGIEYFLLLSDIIDIRADIIKWPHHAHRFPDNERADEIIRRMNEVIKPQYIIWQRHYTQNGFKEYINRFEFSPKFLCSDEAEIFVISFMKGASRIEHFFLLG